MRKHRSSFLLSLLMVVLCGSIIIGSTLAYFTSEQTTDENIIAASTLKAGLDWAYQLPGSEDGWQNAANGVLFNETSWEPNYSAARYIRVKNGGSLAFSYELNVLPTMVVEGGPELMDVIDVYYGVVDADTPAITRSNFAQQLTRMGTMTELLSNEHGAGYGILLPKGVGVENLPAGVEGESGTVTACIVLHMQQQAGNEYMGLSAGEGFKLQLAAVQYNYDDAFANIPNPSLPDVNGYGTEVIKPLESVQGGMLAADMVFTSSNGVTATVPAGAKVDAGVTELKLIVTPKAQSDADVTLQVGEALDAWEVRVEGLAKDNTTPVRISLGAVMQKSLNIGNYDLYHVEGDATNKMTRVDAVDADAPHNSYSYDPATGEVEVAMATFSEVTVVASPAKWEGEYDYSWYTNAVMTAEGDNKVDYIIANADQLAGFGAIVGGMDGQTADTFKGKTVKLITDIDLGDAEDNNNSELIFYPIGYTNNLGTYEKTAGALEDTNGNAFASTVSSFEGIFDGNGHTISNFYQNTWEMFGDYNNGYSGTPNHYKDGMGLFGYVVNGTVKNLTVDNFSSDGEFTPTGVIAAYAVNSTFENIAITNCNPRVYNTGNGGIIGIAGNSNDQGTEIKLCNITVDASNKISALWGSWDVACGGLVGMFRGNADGGTGKIRFDNCHVSAQIDVNNDVCANYQYYAYRYAGMMIGSIRHNEKIDGRLYPNMNGISANGCTVTFGEWVNYYYCELVANTIASYTHDYQFSRLTQVKAVEGNSITHLDGTVETVPVTGRYNYVVVDGSHDTLNAVCYHFVDGQLWSHKDAGKETVDGIVYDVEDKMHVHLPFNQLFTGYGWGVTSKGIEDFDGIETIDVVETEIEGSVDKFVVKTDVKPFETEQEITIDQIFEAKEGNVSPAIRKENVEVFVSPVGDESTVSAAYVANTDDWTKGTLTFSGTGEAEIIITDYFFCNATKVKVNISEKQAVQKFEVAFDHDDAQAGNQNYTDTYLYRVGNQNTVKLSSLFEAKEGAEIGDVSVVIEAMNGTAASGKYTSNSQWGNGTIQFDGTGVVKVTITDDDYCTPTQLLLEVVEAKNATTPISATANNVVYLNNISGTFTVSNGYTVYGNGFTVTLPTTSVQNVGNGFTGYISIGASQDDGIANGGNLDNIRIVGPVYPEMYIYRDQAKITDSSDPDYGDGNNMRYFKNSVIVYGGNCTISNSYISGSRTALCLRGGNNVVIENTTLSGGSYANMQICAGSKVTLRDLTTVQVDTPDSYGKDMKAHGLGIAVDSAVVDIYIEGDLNQYNWLCQNEWNSIVPSTYQSSFPKFFTNNTFSKYWHYLNGGTDRYVNLALIYACNWDTSKIHDNRTTVDYDTCNATIAGVAGGVYSKVNTVGSNALTNESLVEPKYIPYGYNPVAPVFKFDNTNNNDPDDAESAADSYCIYDETTGVLRIGVTGDGKEIDLSSVTITKDGIKLSHTAYLNDSQLTESSVIISATNGAKQILTFEATSNDVGYDQNGVPVTGSIDYSWTINIEIAVLAYPAPVWNMDGDYQFDTSNCYYAYYSTSQGYGEAVPIYEGIKVNYYNKSGTLVNLDLSKTTNLPTGSDNSNTNAFTYTLADGSILTMKFSSGWKSGATTHQFTTYNNKVYIYPQSLDNDNYVRAKTTNQDFDVKITYTFTDPFGQSTSTQTMQWYNAKASNGSVSTVQWKTFDSTNGKKPTVCVTPDTLVTLGDGNKMQICDVNIGDEVLTWNFYTGQYEVMPVSLLQAHDSGMLEVLYLFFDDGTTLKVLGEHGIFDAENKEFIFIDKDDACDYVGRKYLKQDGDGFTEVVLTSYDVVEENTTAYTILSVDHYNVLLEDLLTVTPAHVGGNFFNPFDINEDMKYDETSMKADIEKYGLYTYDDFDHVLTEEQFDALNLGHFKVSVGKGLVTYDGLIYLIENFINKEF